MDVDVSAAAEDFLDDLRSLCGGGPMSQWDMVGGFGGVCLVGVVGSEWWKCSGLVVDFWLE